MTMATYSKRWTLTPGTNTALTTSKDYTGSLVVEVDEAIPDSSTDLEVTLALDVSAVKAFTCRATRPSWWKRTADRLRPTR